MNAVSLCAGAAEWHAIFGADEAVVSEVDAWSVCAEFVEEIVGLLAWYRQAREVPAH